MADIHVVFFDNPPDDLPHKYAVIIARYQGRLLWCRHAARQSWEIPGGHIEPGETALEAAVRELQEETGAVDFTIRPVCWYSAFRADDQPHSLGLLCIAEVHALANELHSEIAEVRPFDDTPDALTYPQIQPCLLAEAQRQGFSPDFRPATAN